MTRIEKVLRAIGFERNECGEWRMTVHIFGEEITYRIEETRDVWGWPTVVVVEVGGVTYEPMDLTSFVIMLDDEDDEVE
jgi:hypothetical protein